MITTVRLCKDCRWAALEENESGMVWRCTHQCSKFVPPPDYVTGKPVTPRQLRCYDARYFDDGSSCGPHTHGAVGWISVCSFAMRIAIIGITITALGCFSNAPNWMRNK
jgi:hypothetical protein